LSEKERNGNGIQKQIVANTFKKYIMPTLFTAIVGIILSWGIWITNTGIVAQELKTVVGNNKISCREKCKQLEDSDKHLEDKIVKAVEVSAGKYELMRKEQKEDFQNLSTQQKEDSQNLSARQDQMYQLLIQIQGNMMNRGDI